MLTACGERETAGLKELLERAPCQIVVSPAGIEAVRALCPPGTSVVSADDLPEKNWFPVSPLLLSGRGRAPVAYLLRRDDKAVLFSGRIPAGFDDESRKELHSELVESRHDTLGYLAALRKLLEVRPDLWLPAAPSEGQNANLYGSSWKEILEKNHRAVDQLLQVPPSR